MYGLTGGGGSIGGGANFGAGAANVGAGAAKVGAGAANVGAGEANVGGCAVNFGAIARSLVRLVLRSKGRSTFRSARRSFLSFPILWFKRRSRNIFSRSSSAAAMTDQNVTWK
jgi:hypothetical protein